MNGSLALTALATAIRLAIGLVFLRSALAKARHPLAFVQAVQGYAILPPAMTGPAAIGILSLEGGLAFVFLSGWGFQWRWPVALGLLGLFTLAVGINLRRGRRIPCGCFGTTDEPISPRSMVRLILLESAILTVGIRTLEEPPGWGGWPALFLAAFLLLSGMWMLDLPVWIRLFRI